MAKHRLEDLVAKVSPTPYGVWLTPSGRWYRTGSHIAYLPFKSRYI